MKVLLITLITSCEGFPLFLLLLFILILVHHHDIVLDLIALIPLGANAEVVGDMDGLVGELLGVKHGGALDLTLHVIGHIGAVSLIETLIVPLLLDDIAAIALLEFLRQVYGLVIGELKHQVILQELLEVLVVDMGVDGDDGDELNSH